MSESKVGQGQTLRMQRLVNGLTKAMLRTPLVSKGIGKRLMLLHVVGRKTGRQYDVPLAYTRHDGVLVVGTSFGWARNLRTGEPLQIRLQGALRTAEVEVIADEEGVMRYYDILCRDNRNFAKFNNIGYTSAGEPESAHLRAAFAAGARVFLLTPT